MGSAQKVVLLLRHGARSPIRLPKGLSKHAKFWGQPGNLTQLGYTQLNSFGRFLSTIYPQLVSKTRIISADTQRTIESAKALIQGMQLEEPPSVRIMNRANPEEDIFYRYRSPDFQEIIPSLHKNPQWISKVNSSQTLRTILDRELQETVSLYNLRDLSGLLRSYEIHWLQNPISQSPGVIDQVHQYASWVMKYWYSFPHLLDFLAENLIEKIRTEIRESPEGLSIIVAHDYTVLTLAAAVMPKIMFEKLETNLYGAWIRIVVSTENRVSVDYNNTIVDSLIDFI